MTTNNTGPETPIRTIAFGSIKGGSGSSTIAAATAVKASKEGITTLLIDNGHQSSLAAILGLPEPMEGGVLTVNANLHLVRIRDLELIKNYAKLYDLIVIDTDTPADVKADRLYLVTRNCYLSARLHVGSTLKWDGMVLNHETDRPLTPKDMSSVLGIPLVATVKVSPLISRATDAGTLPDRIDSIEEFNELTRLIPAVKEVK